MAVLEEPKQTSTETVASAALRHPVRTILVIAAVALAIELAQYREELFPGAHGLSEFVRNLAYALVGAVIFNWIVVELPEQRRRRAAYELNWLALDLLIKIGPSNAALYRAAMPDKADELDVWARDGVGRFANDIDRQVPTFFDPHRVQLLQHTIHGVQVALDGMESARYFLDPDVSHALAVFPSSKGFQQLQVDVDERGRMKWQRDAHIVWELLAASRRLYAALNSSAPYVSFDIEAGDASLSNGSISQLRTTDLVR